MAVEEYVNNPLWAVLVETVHAMIMYPHHKAYVETSSSTNSQTSPPQT